MLNYEIYNVDPRSRKLVNEGVANVNIYNQEVYQYELSTFVCDGQYEKGLDHILSTYLSNLGRAQQPGVWVSGFYGSGKSHLVKMLSAFWTDIKFDDGTTARSIARLSESIRSSLHELSIRGKQNGGLHAAMGTLGSRSITSVRLALLQIIFASVGLPEQYPIARFVMWLKKEQILDQVIQKLKLQDVDFSEEVNSLHVAEDLHKVLVELKPGIFPTTGDCVKSLNNTYPVVRDISNNEMIATIKEALSVSGQFPLTLIVLDEVQQYIGSDSRRSMDVQEVVEACCKDLEIGGKLLFVATGQSAVTGTNDIKKLEGRFTVRVELSDTDVDSVIRQVVLAKKATAISSLEDIRQRYQGELSRHLNGTSLHHTQKDFDNFLADYPILPVRRRFWENALRILDGSGTDSQLRNQLSMVHRAVQTNIEKPLGNVIPADYLYFDLADKMLQARILPRNVYEKTMSWYSGTPRDRLTARACALVFLINYVAQRYKDIGISATVDTLADLMIDDLSVGSSQLRIELPQLLDHCELILKTGSAYAIQTEESTAWQEEYLSQTRALGSSQAAIDEERENKLTNIISTELNKMSVIQGISKEARTASIILNSNLPVDSMKNLYVWIRSGWSVTEDSVRAEARAAGNQSPTIFVFIPKKSPDQIRQCIIELKAATATLLNRGTPVDTPEWRQARSAMDMQRTTAENNLRSLIKDVIQSAKVYQAGGNEVVTSSLKESVLSALKNSVTRLYNCFEDADSQGWDSVYSAAKQGAPDALKKIGYEGDPDKHPVCKALIGYIGSGKKGIDIRSYFESPPYGWSGDAIDGALQVLLISGSLRLTDEHGKSPDNTTLERKSIGKCTFKVESITITAKMRIDLRKLFLKAQVTAESGKEIQASTQFIDKLDQMKSASSGPEPLPATERTELIDNIRYASGNEQLLKIHENMQEISLLIDQWERTIEKIKDRKPSWDKFLLLRNRTNNMPELNDLEDQAKAVESQRLLLTDPDPVKALQQQWENLVRLMINDFSKKHSEQFNHLMNGLQSDENWNALTNEHRDGIILEYNLHVIEDLNTSSFEELIQCLKKYPPQNWNDRLAALSQHFREAHAKAAKLAVPESHPINIVRRTLRTKSDIDAWLNEMKKTLEKAIEEGPVVLR